MPAFHVSKSVHINAPVEKVYAAVRDFKQWPAWSPWLVSEPDCSLNYEADGSGYSWDGKIIGAGEIKVSGEDEPNRIYHKLAFLRPFKSKADVHFTFSEKDGGTEVSWNMDSSLPFFMFFMTKMMVAFIGSDYERGLNMLKDYVENGSVPSKLEFAGIQSFKGCTYIGKESSCAVEDLGPSMEKDMKRIGEWLKESGTTPSGAPLSIYSKWDLVNGQATYTIGVPLASTPSSVPADLVTGEIPARNYYKIRHTGPYRHLGNAWTSGYGHGRAKVFAQDKKAPPFEIYENDPTETAENDLVTVVHFPAK